MQKKMSALMMALVLSLSLIGCGGSSQPVNGEVADSTESTESNIETVTADQEAATKTEEITDGKVASSDKPVEPSATSTAEPSATGKPESTAGPTASPTEKPQATATPEPTAPPHVHEYAESITVQPTCAVAGEKKLTCSCGDTKTESIPASGEHNWVEQTQIIHHDEVGITKTVQVGTNKRTVYYCSYCRFTLGLGDDAFSSDNEADITDHQAEAGQAILDAGGTRDEAIAHALANGFCIDYDDPVYEEQYVVQSPAYDETVVTGYVCSTCGATK